MFDPSTSNTASTLTEILGWAREVSIIGFIVGIAWKMRGFYDDAKTFFERIETHMVTMETFARTTTLNHLKHIEKALNTMANIEPEKDVDDQS